MSAFVGETSRRQSDRERLDSPGRTHAHTDGQRENTVLPAYIYDRRIHNENHHVAEKGDVGASNALSNMT